MDEKRLFQMTLNLSDPPWQVVSVAFDQPSGRFDIHINFRSGSRFLSPDHSSKCREHDTIKREWRHLNFFHYHAYSHARDKGPLTWNKVS